MIDPAIIDEYVDLERYGLGVPMSLAALGLASLAFVIPGLMAFGAESNYGKIGIVMILAVSILSIFAAGLTYQEVNTDQWMKTEEEDGPGESGSEGNG